MIKIRNGIVHKVVVQSLQLLSVKEFESKFASKFMKLSIYITGKDTQIKKISTNPISKLDIRMQMSGIECTQIETFAMDKSCKFARMRKDNERGLISDMGTSIPT